MQRRKMLIAALTASMLFTMTGCGAGGRILRDLGRAIEKTTAARAGEEPVEESVLPTPADAEETPDPKGEDQDSADDIFSNSDDPGKEAQEAVPGQKGSGERTTREGVTSLDDIFSGESNKEEQGDNDSGDFEDEMLSYDEYITANLEKCKSDLAADKGSVQSEVESDTVQWMNATYALITESNGGDRTLVGGMERNIINALFMRYQLYTGWGIEDRESADEVIEWLRSEGHRQEYMEYVEAFEESGLFLLEEEEFDQAIRDAFGAFGNYTLNYLKTIYECNKVCGENGILAWDLCRLNQVAAWCYVAGYYTLDESLEIQYQNSLLIQNSFSSWDDMMESYLYGFQYWKGDSGNSTFSETTKRRNIYSSLKEISGGPYKNEFARELQRSWQVEQ